MGAISTGYGWHLLENDPDRGESFRWASSAFSLVVSPGLGRDAMLCMDILNPLLVPVEVRIDEKDGAPLDTLILLPGRRNYFVVLDSEKGRVESFVLEFATDNELGPEMKGEDTRELSIRFYRLGLEDSLVDFEQSDWLSVDRGPKVLTIETTTKCNLNCPMCRQNWDDPPCELPAEFSPRYLEKIQNIAHKAELVVLHAWGEPLLSDSFYQMVDLFHEQPPKIGFNSNGTIVDERLLKAVSEEKIAFINFSLDAATPETYESIRNYSFEKVLGNIQSVLNARNEKGLSHPRVYVNMTLMRRNIAEAPLFVDLAKRLGVDCVYFWHLCDYPWLEGNRGFRPTENDGSVFDYEKELLKNAPEESDSYLRAALERGEEIGMEIFLCASREVFFLETENLPPACWPSVEHSRYCTWPWEEISVRADGGVWYCWWQSTRAADTPFAHLDDVDDLEEIWNGDALRGVRASLALNRLLPVCENASCKYKSECPR